MRKRHFLKDYNHAIEENHHHHDIFGALTIGQRWPSLIKFLFCVFSVSFFVPTVFLIFIPRTTKLAVLWKYLIMNYYGISWQKKSVPKICLFTSRSWYLSYSLLWKACPMWRHHASEQETVKKGKIRNHMYIWVIWGLPHIIIWKLMMMLTRGRSRYFYYSLYKMLFPSI